MRIISWNMRGSAEAWRVLGADVLLDVALVQEAHGPPPAEAGLEVVAGGSWVTAGWEQRGFSTAVLARSSVAAKEVRSAPLGVAGYDELAVSRPGTLAVAEVEGPGLSGPVIVASVYSAWERPVPYESSSWIYADASAHRLISDLSALIGRARHRLIVAGDWNVLQGFGERGDPYWGGRYQTVFDRLEAIGLSLVGPRLPGDGRSRQRVEEVPKDLEDEVVPTFRRDQADPPSATRQLDFVFASDSLAPFVTTRALDNQKDSAPDGWGPSDHCRVEIVIDES